MNRSKIRKSIIMKLTTSTNIVFFFKKKIIHLQQNAPYIQANNQN